VVTLVVTEALDARYLVHVKYLEGREAPVVCFYLADKNHDDTQDDDADDNSTG
jgi:hypothetical protein